MITDAQSSILIGTLLISSAVAFVVGLVQMSKSTPEIKETPQPEQEQEVSKATPEIDMDDFLDAYLPTLPSGLCYGGYYFIPRAYDPEIYDILSSHHIWKRYYAREIPDWYDLSVATQQRVFADGRYSAYTYPSASYICTEFMYVPKWVQDWIQHRYPDCGIVIKD